MYRSLGSSSAGFSVLSLLVGAFACGGEDPPNSGSGGSANPGGTSNGGATTGGASTTNGGSNAGGNQSTSGGKSGTGGKSSSGGATAGGAANTGGSAGTGGTPVSSCGVSCSSAPSGACSAPQVRISEVDVGMTVAYSAQEVTLKVIAIAPMPGGGSRLAWLSNNAVQVAQLDCEDKLLGAPFALPAFDLQDIHADENGGAVLLTRNAQGGGTNNCGDESKLCGLSGPSPSCYEMHTSRFDCSGKELWATQLGTSSASAPPYATNGGKSNHFIWSNYQHHGRLAFDGQNYAAYFCEAITVANGSCVDIHEGDRMQVVGPTGTRLTGHDSFETGCSHSGFTRMVWDPGAGHFIMICKTDNNNRLAMPNPYRTVYPLNLDGSFVGDIIVAKGGGYWTTVSNNGAVHLLHFSTGQSDQDINLASANYPHLGALGPDHMVAAWASGSSATSNMTGQVRDRQTGAEVSPPFSIAVPGNPYLSFKSYPDGSAAYVTQGTSNTKIRIARVMPCSG